MAMTTYHITCDGFEMTPADMAYVEKRFARFEKFAREGKTAEVSVMSRKQTPHERGHAYKVEASFKSGAGDHFVTAEEKDFYTAVDAASAELFREVTARIGRRRTLISRGRQALKKMLKR